MNATTNTRVTLVSSLESGDPKLVAEVFVKQNRTPKEVQKFSTLVNQALKISKQMIREAQAQAKAEQEAREKEQRESEALEAKRRALINTGMNAAKQVYTTTLIANGLPREIALEMTEKHFANTFPMGKVTVKFGNKIFETSVKGKQSRELKAALEATGYTRREFIEQYAI